MRLILFWGNNKKLKKLLNRKRQYSILKEIKMDWVFGSFELNFMPTVFQIGFYRSRLKFFIKDELIVEEHANYFLMLIPMFPIRIGFKRSVKFKTKKEYDNIKRYYDYPKRLLYYKRKLLY
jgi:hypothetical protein